MSESLGSWQHLYSGKVRELYRSPEHPGLLLVAASDRVSAFDHVLEPAIPGKGALLTELSLWWFAQLSEFPNHLAKQQDLIPEPLAGRSMLVRELQMHPIEAVVRGYLTGSGWKEYQQFGAVCGVSLPEGLQDGDRLPEPIYTPAWKAPQGEHDENISYERTVELVGAQTAAAIRDTALAIYRQGSALALERGIIIADTKFEFGADPVTGELTLADEVLTSDSSRYWEAEAWLRDRSAVSFDKQIVRNWLLEHWNGEGTPPALPAEIVQRTLDRYRELKQLLTS